MAEQNIDLFPTSLNVTVAPERLTADVGPVLENVRVDAPSGRIKRRLGMAQVTGMTDGTHQIISCLAMVRVDGVHLLFDVSDVGTLRVSTNPQAAWDDADDFGGFGSDEWLENFSY